MRQVQTSEATTTTARRAGPPALVIGFSIHGLAVARALASQGVVVHGLSELHLPRQPTAFTRFATMHFHKGLNSAPLADCLLDLAEKIGSRDKIVLFPTSDRIAKGLASDWDKLSRRYALSWTHCRELVLSLQRKDSLAVHCERAGVKYPQTRIVADLGGSQPAVNGLRFPLVVKPAQPLSSFKAIRVENLAALEHCIKLYSGDLPFVAQEWVDGPERSLYSCTAYVDHGVTLYAFTSRKIAARPAGIGQGTVFEIINDAQTYDIAVRFLATLDLSGPVAVEFKRDFDGQYWLIEPNVGRTEYCVDLAIRGGFNIPHVEYLHVTGRLSEWVRPLKMHDCVWFDTDKDPLCFLSNISAVRGMSGGFRTAVFPYLGHGDWKPLAVAASQRVLSLAWGFSRRLGRRLGSTTD